MAKHHIQVLELESLQYSIYRFRDFLGRESQAIDVRVFRLKVNFGRDDQGFSRESMFLEDPPVLLFTLACSIALGRVEEVDAIIIGYLDNLGVDFLLLRRVFAEPVSEAKHRDLETRFAEEPVFHFGFGLHGKIFKL